MRTFIAEWLRAMAVRYWANFEAWLEKFPDLCHRTDLGTATNSLFRSVDWSKTGHICDLASFYRGLGDEKCPYVKLELGTSIRDDESES